MVKKLFSFVPVVHNHKAKLMKKRAGKNKSLLKRVFHFLKSDTYMFAPLVSSQNSPFTTSSAGVETYEHMMKKRKDSSGNVKDYMKSDCYMYAPLVSSEPWFRAPVSPPAYDRPGPVSSCETTADKISQNDTTKSVGEENKGLGQTSISASVAEQHADGYPYTRSAVIRHTLLQKETVKHVIQQNIRSSPVEGDKKKERSGRKGAKSKGSFTGQVKKKTKVTGIQRLNFASETKAQD